MSCSRSNCERTAESILETKAIINGLLSGYTGKTVEEIDEATAFDNDFNADEAVEFGLCDHVIDGFFSDITACIPTEDQT